jgi:type II secretory pathway component PulF
MIRALRTLLAIIGALFCAGVMIALAVNALPLFLVLSPIFLAIIVALVIDVTGSARRRRSMLVLSYVEQAVRLNLPFPQMLSAAAASEPRPTARLLTALRLELESGTDIADAFRRTNPAVGPRILALLDSAQRLGRLPQTLQRIFHEAAQRRLEDPIERSFLATYPPILAAAILAITTMLMIFVMPKFKQIFLDFHTPLPGITQLLVAISFWFTDDYGWLIVLLVFFAATYLLPRWASRPNRFTRNRDWADICRVMSDALEAGLPLDAALRQSAELSISSSVREKLRNWAARAEQGQSPSDAARAAAVPSLIVGMTTTGLASANLVDVFRFLARYYSGKFSRLAILMRGAAVPAVAFFFGAVVAFVSLSLFTPMIALLDSISHYRGAL